MDAPIDILSLFKSSSETPGGGSSSDVCWAYDEWKSPSQQTYCAKLLHIAPPPPDDGIAPSPSIPSSSSLSTKQLVISSLEFEHIPLCGTIPVSRSNRASCLCFDTLLAVSSNTDEHSIHLYNFKEKKLVAQLSGHTSPVFYLCAFRSGKQELLASASFDKTIKIWDLQIMTCIHTLSGSGFWTSLCHSSSLNHLFAGDYSGNISVFSTNPPSSSPFGNISTGSSINDLTLSPDGATLASAHQNGRIVLWNTSSSYTELRSWKAEGDPVAHNGLRFSPDGSKLAGHSQKGTIYIWNVHDGSLCGNSPVNGMASSSRTSICFSPNGKHMVACSSANSVCIYETESQKLVKTLDSSSSSSSSPIVGILCTSDFSTLIPIQRDASDSSILIYSLPSQQHDIPVQQIYSCPELAVDMRLIKLASHFDSLIAVVRGRNNVLSFSIVPVTAASPQSELEWHTITYLSQVEDDDTAPRPRPMFETLIPEKLFKVSDNQPDSNTHTFEPIFFGEYSALFRAQTDMLSCRLAAMNGRELELKERQEEFDAFKRRFESYSVQMESCIDSVLTEITFAKHSADELEKQQAMAAQKLLSRIEVSLREKVDASMTELRALSAHDEQQQQQNPEELPSSGDSSGSSSFLNWKMIELHKEIGSNGFGSVYLCKFNADGNPFVTIKVPARTVRETLALYDSSSSQVVKKSTRIPTEIEQSIRKAMEAEIVTLKKLTHPNVLRYLGCTASPASWRPVCIVQQYCAAGDLHSYLQAFYAFNPFNLSDEDRHLESIVADVAAAASSSSALAAPVERTHEWTEKMAFQAALQIAGGLASLHKQGIVHRDLKSSNILIIQFPADVLDMTVYKVSNLSSANFKHWNDELASASVAAAAPELSPESEPSSPSAPSSSVASGKARKRNMNPNANASDLVTSRFSPPEFFRKKDRPVWANSMAQDVWAYGLILFQMRTGLCPFDDHESEATIPAAIFDGESPGNWPEEDEEVEAAQVADLSRPWCWLRTVSESCLEFSPEKRLDNWRGQSADEREVFSVIEKRLQEMKPQWAKETHSAMLKFQRIEIRDPYLKAQQCNS